MKLGKLPVKHDSRTLRFARYLPVRLTAPPPKVDRYSNVPAWPMYANDVLGCCGPAGAAHQIQSWSTYGKGPVTPTTDQVKAAYFAITGGADTGVYLLDMLNYWRNTGIAGDKVEAFVSISPNLDELRLAVHLFGSSGLGLSLPDGGVFGPWTVLYGAPNPRNGHYVVAVGYDDATRRITTISWGRKMSMSYDFFLKYSDENYAVLNDLSLNAQGVSPAGFDYARLLDDLKHLKDPVTPAVVTTPSASSSASSSASGSPSSSSSGSASPSSSASASSSSSISASPSSSESGSESGSSSESASSSASGSESASPSLAPPIDVLHVVLHMSDGTQQTFVRS
jgi:hypothetical protein